tara:strand:- start:4065 stop:4295 length:231 start_codon:yes stop_codon:yes gene_type:complete
MAELVSIAEFDNVNEAYVIKARLESEGIRCYLSNENLNSIFGASISFTQVKLQVNLNDSFKAMDILYEEQDPSESD